MSGRIALKMMGCLCLWLGLVISVAQAQNSLQLIDSQEIVRLSNHFKILQEKGEPLTLEQVIERKYEFSWQAGHNPNYGFNDHGVWLNVSFSNVTDTQQWVIDLGFTQLDKVDFYLVSEGFLLTQSQQGKTRLTQQYRFPTIAVELPYATKVELYVRIESADNSLIAPIDIQSQASHIRTTFFDNLLWGLFYGGLLILAIYNFVLYFGNREVSLLAYVGYISTALLWQFVWGGHMQMLFPYGLTSWLASHMDLIFVIIGIGSGIFTYTFLEAGTTAPKSAPVIKTSIGLLAIMGLLSMFSLLPPLLQNGLVYLFSIVAISSYLIAGFESYFNQFHSARYFIFAWSILACCALIGMLSLVGVFPSNFFTTYCFQFGVFLEAGLFSLALMDKSRNRLESEIQQATNDLRNNIEFIEEQNVRLDIARKDAIKASHVKSQFLANMSHEIRTPLNAILGFSKELNKMALPTDTLEHVRTINSAADNLLNIVNDVLDVSKIEAGKLQINNQAFSPTQLLEEVVSLMANSAHLHELEFVFDMAPLPDKLIGDPTRIKQVLNNLLGNALKFTPTGHVSLTARGRELEHGTYELHFQVEDSGIGISQQDRKKLFTAFSQVDDALSRSYQGTGLGLVICQQLVKMMHGKITLTSEPGEGSCFAVTIRTNLLNPNPSLHPLPDWEGQKVALVDPFEPTRLSSAAMLSHLGAKVVQFDDYLALQKLGSGYDALILSLPFSQKEQRESVYDRLDKLEMGKKMVLYSGSQPFVDRPLLSYDFDAQIRLPLTQVKLLELSGVRPNQDTPDLLLQLQQLPKARVLAVDDMEMNLRLLEYLV